MLKWLRENKYAAGLLLVLRVYVGYEWMKAGWHKVTGGFDAAGFMKGAIAKPVLDSATKDAIYPTFVAFLKNFAFPNVKLFNILVPWGELLVGLGLILGALTTAAIFFGLLMNFVYMFAGTMSTNPWLVLLGTFIIAAGANAGKFGADYYVLPFLRKMVNKTFETHNHGTKGKTNGNKRMPAHV